MGAKDWLLKVLPKWKFHYRVAQQNKRVRESKADVSKNQRKMHKLKCINLPMVCSQPQVTQNAVYKPISRLIISSSLTSIFFYLKAILLQYKHLTFCQLILFQSWKNTSLSLNKKNSKFGHLLLVKRYLERCQVD